MRTSVFAPLVFRSGCLTISDTDVCKQERELRKLLNLERKNNA